jgi:esterase/lipase superfamily enzyme
MFKKCSYSANFDCMLTFTKAQVNLGKSHSRWIGQMSRLLTVIVCLSLGAFIPTQATAKDNRVLLAAVRANAQSTPQMITLPDDTARIYAIELVSLNRQVKLTRVVISYRNGQQHYEDRPIVLKPGEPSGPIGERDERLAVETVSVTYSNVAGADTTTIQVWGQVLPAALRSNRPVSPGLTPREDISSEELAQGYREVGVFFGTTRVREADRLKNGRQIATFSGEEGNGLILGQAIVTIPFEREIGSIPRADFDLIFGAITLRPENPKLDFTVAGVDVLSHADFVDKIKTQLSKSSKFVHQAFVFVHGYNVSFEDGIFRAAQIAHDIGFDGPVICYSWPSRGAMLDYKHDADAAKSSREGLLQLLSTVATETGAEKINVIAHSMGNDPLLEVLSREGEIKQAGGAIPDLKLNEILLAAPDVGRLAFQQLAAKVKALPHSGVTLYASANDKTMRAARAVAGGIVRAGDVPREGPVIVDGVESIDVSSASTAFFGTNHSAFAARTHLVQDIRLLFEKGTHPPDDRFAVFQIVGSAPKEYWRYLPN